MLTQTISLLSLTMAIAIMVPQIQHLFMLKRSEDMKLLKWSFALSYKLIAVIVAIFIRATAYVFVGAVWVLLYMIMIALIIRYRSPARAENFAPQIIEPTINRPELSEEPST